LWVVAKQLPSTRDVGERLGDIARLRRLAIDDGVGVELFFE
jgi:hypothetical protein